MACSKASSDRQRASVNGCMESLDRVAASRIGAQAGSRDADAADSDRAFAARSATPPQRGRSRNRNPTKPKDARK